MKINSVELIDLIMYYECECLLKVSESFLSRIQAWEIWKTRFYFQYYFIVCAFRLSDSQATYISDALESLSQLPQGNNLEKENDVLEKLEISTIRKKAVADNKIIEN